MAAVILRSPTSHSTFLIFGRVKWMDSTALAPARGAPLFQFCPYVAPLNSIHGSGSRYPSVVNFLPFPCGTAMLALLLDVVQTMVLIRSWSYWDAGSTARLVTSSASVYRHLGDVLPNLLAYYRRQPIPTFSMFAVLEWSLAPRQKMYPYDLVGYADIFTSARWLFASRTIWRRFGNIMLRRVCYAHGHGEGPRQECNLSFHGNERFECDRWAAWLAQRFPVSS